MRHVGSLTLATVIIYTCIGCVPTTADDRVSAPIDLIRDVEVRQIMQRALESAGGWQAWVGIDSLAYIKRSVLYLPDSTTESDVTQVHKYRLNPELSGQISWSDGEDQHEIIYTRDAAYRVKNGQRVEGSELSAQQSFMSAYYVLFIPFKLLDPGTVLTYEGIQMLSSGNEVDVIKATYDPGAHENHSTQDTWWYYFDHNTGAHLGSMVYHTPTYALIENTETTEDFPIRLNTYRESFRCDSLRNKQYLRGVFYYSDYVFH